MTADNVGAGCCLGQQRLKKSKRSLTWRNRRYMIFAVLKCP
jgi:hypothetical protein